VVKPLEGQAAGEERTSDSRGGNEN